MFAKKTINVTRPAMPPLEEYLELLKPVWESGILTHDGKVLLEFERSIRQKFGLPNFLSVLNGTAAIQIAIKALDVKGEIITTPFSWVATLSAIQWEKCTPVFCDIDPETFNIDPSKIEALITERTTAIMPVHVFGNACDVDAIQEIAGKYNLRVIYDGAHALGSEFNGKSLLSYGDISTTSFHATKILNSAEGGGCFTASKEIYDKLRRIRFFGHNDSKEIVEEGCNGKLSELHAALGLANLKYYEEVASDRKNKYAYYRAAFSGMPGYSFQRVKHGATNFSYFPLLFKTNEAMNKAQEALAAINIYPRRYFYPSLNTCTALVPYTAMPVSEDISSRILCLPLYYTLAKEDMDLIITTILKAA